MDLRELLIDIDYELIKGSLGIEIGSVEYDSREVKTGSVFIAIKGYETDGHLYIDKAIGNGASAIILEDEAYMREDIQGCTIIKVDKSRRALASISSAFYGYPGSQLTVIGVTGTNGKTSITYLLKNIFKHAGYKVGVIGTIENQIDDVVYESNVTTPESRDVQLLLRKMVDKGCKYCVMEASSHALYLDRVASIPFKGAIFTNLTQDHLDFHKDLDEYLNAKKILFTYIDESGYSVINIDDKAGQMIMKEAGGTIVTYGLHSEADFKANDIRMDLYGTSYKLDYDGSEIDVKLKLIGEFSIYNSLAAIATAYKLGIDMEDIKSGIAEVSVNGRFQIVESEKDFAVVVDYAHTPDGLLNVLQTARKITDGRLITVFGCGGDRDRKKRPIMGRVAGELSDLTIITSDNPRTENPDTIIDMIEDGVRETTDNYMKIENRKDAIKEAISQAQKNDIIIIAGKGHEDYQIIGKVKYPFSDVEIAGEILRNKG